MTPPPPTHYSILNIPYPPRHPLLKQDLKLAYHRALLKHHPDKDKSRSGTNTPTPTPTPTPTSTPSHSNGNSISTSIHNNRTDSGADINGGDGVEKTTYTIDQITTAYKTLSDPVARAGYERELRLAQQSGLINNNVHTATTANGGATGDDTMFRTGLETFDLDDMTEAEAGDDGGIWYRSCRCGEERGFLVSEEDLEREVERGEVVVGCVGCSLWARVVFGVDEGEGEEGEEGVS
ncbi:hypothetical protein FQN50_009421 [Emmonsiellopsis sp. PD_5]|nr:hypothetical protein FQN50_009421 [Emmonsiellopsis sp. PD_5]